jgi:hypothetical protein
MKFFAIVVLLVSILFFGIIYNSYLNDNARLNGKIAKIADKIEDSNNLEEQTILSEEIFVIMKNSSCRILKKQTLFRIIELLDIEHDGVRYWIARGLMRIGPCAKVAIPKLKQIRTRAECWPGSMNSGDTVRAVIEKFSEYPIGKVICTAPAEGYIRK